MGQIFQSFIGGVDAGNQQREQRDRRNALDEAGRLYGAGNAEGAENALMAAGLTQEAANYSALAEARRARTVRGRISGAMTNLDPNATPSDRLQAGASAALEAGGVDEWTQLQQTASQMSAQQRAEAAERSQWLGSAAASLRGVPQDQRLAQARALLQNSPYANDPHMQALVDDDASDLSDAALDSAANNALSAADILAGRERRERYAVQDRQFQQSLAAQHAARSGDQPLSNSERMRLAGAYQTDQEQALNQLGILRPSLPYARLAVSLGGDTTHAEGINFRQSDVALLRAAARAQTGPGVLTESEVFSTLSPSLQQDFIRNRAYLDIAQSGLRPEDRASLAQFVMQSAGNIQRDLWNQHRNYTQEWGSNPGAPTFNPPTLPHPDDEYLLQSRERAGAQVGREYVGGNGRTYVYRGPGQWEFSRMGGTVGGETHVYDPPSAPSGEAAQTGWTPGQPIPQAAIARVRSNPALLQEFARTFHVSEDEARRLTGQQQGPSVTTRPDGPMRRG